MSRTKVSRRAAEKQVNRLVKALKRVVEVEAAQAKLGKDHGLRARKLERRENQAVSALRSAATDTKDQLAVLAAQGRDAVAPAAARVADTVKPYVENAKDAVRPYVEDAAALAKPYLDDAATRAKPYLKNAKDAVSGATDFLKPYVEDAKDTVKDVAERAEAEYLPRAKRALKSARQVATEHGEEAVKKGQEVVAKGQEVALEGLTVASSAKKAAAQAAKSAKAATKEAAKAAKKAAAPKPKHRFGKVIGVSLALGGVAAAAYFLWKRAQPTEDPWADSFWEDVDIPAEEGAEEAESDSERQQGAHAAGAGEANAAH
ncbi:hypothetical protein [Neoactinobaculum massilliense]|uniref:hypothetical protein n=1 Tax=Neoactinobaculum massilliense TaxID=2364794 RepID=UPI000F539ACB|nr:hypothetical protein [Neoactinobaculum massilliense]